MLLKEKQNSTLAATSETWTKTRGLTNDS